MSDQDDLGIYQFTLKVIANMLVSLEPEGEEQEKFRANFKVISSSFASLPLKVPGTAFHRGLKVLSYSTMIREEYQNQIKTFA